MPIGTDQRHLWYRGPVKDRKCSLSNHFPELHEVDLSISIQISGLDHFLDLLVRDPDGEAAQDELELVDADDALAVTVEPGSKIGSFKP